MPDRSQQSVVIAVSVSEIPRAQHVLAFPRSFSNYSLIDAGAASSGVERAI